MYKEHHINKLMPELYFQGFSEYELEALRISNIDRDRCLPHLVPYRKCLANLSRWNKVMSNLCEQERVPYVHCKDAIINYTEGNDLKLMKRVNPAAYRELNLSPTIDKKLYNTSWFNRLWMNH